MSDEQPPVDAEPEGLEKPIPLVMIDKESFVALTAGNSQRPSRLERAKSWITFIERLFISLAVFVAIVILGVATIREINQETLVIEPFEVPKSYAESMGINGNALAKLLRAEINRIQAESSTVAQRARLEAFDEDQTIDATLPGVGLSLGSLLNYFKNGEKRLSGALMFGCDISDRNRACLFLQISGRPGYISESFDISELSGAMTPAAAYVFRNYSAFVYAAYLLEIDPDTARKEMLAIVRGDSIGDPAYAANGLYIYYSNYDADIQKALYWVDRAIRFDSKLAIAHNNRGNALRELGRYDEAFAAFDRALELDPDYAFAHNNRGNALREMGRYDEAFADYDRALELDPDYAGAHNNRGYALQDLGRYDEAVDAYNLALELDPGYALAHNNRGNALQDLGRYDEAFAAYSRALELDPDYAFAHNNRGSALQRLGRYDEAFAAYDRALELDPDYADAHNNRGNALQDLGRFDEAVDAYDRALELDPDYAFAHNNRGSALQRLGRYDEAIEAYDRALEIDPVFETAIRNRRRLTQRR